MNAVIQFDLEIYLEIALKGIYAMLKKSNTGDNNVN